MPHRLLLPLAWLTLLLAAGLMAFHIPLDSDRLYFDALFSDLAAGGRWEDWRLPPAPGHVPDLLLYALAFEWLPTPLWRLHFVSACQALLAGLSALLLLRQVAPRGTRAGAPAVRPGYGAAGPKVDLNAGRLPGGLPPSRGLPPQGGRMPSRSATAPLSGPQGGRPTGRTALPPRSSATPTPRISAEEIGGP